MPRNIGGMGEKLLGTWADEIDVIANKSQDRDATGWDYILEWRLDNSAEAGEIRLPLDRSPSLLKCVVQVKSTNTAIRESVKLSNWYYLVRNPFPAFFLIVSYSNKRTCQAAYLVHVGEALIAEVLKRIRQLEAESPGFRLNKKTMTLTWGDENQLPTLDGEGLEAAINKHVGDDFDQYIQSKQKLIQRVGYDESSWAMNLTIQMPTNVDPQDHVIDFALGIVHQLEITSSVVYDERFGMKLQRSSITHGMLLQIAELQSEGDGQVEIINTEADRCVKIKCQVYMPRSFGRHVSREKLRARFAHPFVDLVVPITTPSGPFKFNIQLPPPNKAVPLRDLHDVAKVILLTNEASKTQSLVRLTASFLDFSRSGTIEVSSPMSPLLVDWARIVHDAWLIARHFELDEKLELSTREIARLQDPLQALSGFVDRQSGSFRISFWLSESESMDGKQCCIPLVAMARLADHFVAIGAAVIGTMCLTGAKNGDSLQYEVMTYDTRIVCETTRFDAGSAVQKAEEIKKAIERKYEGMVIVHIDR